MTPSKTCRPDSSALNPSYKNCRKQRPDCDTPKPYENLTADFFVSVTSSGFFSDLSYFKNDSRSRMPAKPSPCTIGP